VKTNTRRARGIGGIIVLLAAATFARAEDVEKRFRVGLAVGAYDTSDEVRSDSANLLVLVEPSGAVTRVVEDPRNDDAVIGSLRAQAAWRATVSAQYAFTKLFVLEGAAGYQTGDVRDLEIQAEFTGEQFDNTRRRSNFHVFNTPAGTLTQVPLQLTALARFRPKATFNPFFGAGVGYTFVGFDPSDQLDTISSNLDAAAGEFAKQADFPGGLSSGGVRVNLAGASVDAPDTFEWHLAGGAEIGFQKKWSVIVDARYTWTSASFHIRFNGSDSLGVSVPNGTQEVNSVYGTTDYGTFLIPAPGGLIDGGCLVPTTMIVEGAQVSCGQPLCTTEPQSCVFIRPGGLATNPEDRAGPKLHVNLPQSDGVPDPGYYYIQGGEIDYKGLSIQVGVRYTF